MNHGCPSILPKEESVSLVTNSSRANILRSKKLVKANFLTPGLGARTAICSTRKRKFLEQLDQVQT